MDNRTEKKREGQENPGFVHGCTEHLGVAWIRHSANGVWA